MFLVFALTLSCASPKLDEQSWTQYRFAFPGETFSFSAPRTSFPVKFVPRIDLTTPNKKVTLFNGSWIFRGPVSDKGALELFFTLSTADVGESGESLQRAVIETLAPEFAKLNVTVSKLDNVRSRRFGGRDWMCYRLPVFRDEECVLRIDDRHYVSWSFSAINAMGTSIPERDSLKAAIERSFKIDF
jgi:hypothetical protein